MREWQISDYNQDGLSQYKELIYDNSAHMNVVFDSNRKIIHCNSIAMDFFGVSSLDELSAAIVELDDEEQPSGQQSMSVLMQKFDEAEANTVSEFEFVLFLNDIATDVQIIIKCVPFEDAFIFVATGYDISKLRDAEKKLIDQDIYLNALNVIGEVLLSSTHETFDDSISNVLEIIGHSFSASRVTICSMTEDDILPCTNIYDWRITKESKEQKQAGCVVCHLDDWKKSLMKGTMVCCSLTNANEKEKEFLIQNGIKTVTLAPIIIDNKSWGCIGLFDEEKSHVFSASGISAISGVANLLASAIIRNEAAGLLIDSINTNETILDTNPFTCVMFDEEVNILYANPMAIELFGLTDSDDINRDFSNVIGSMIPEYQPDGRKTLSLPESLKKTFDEGYCDFETMFIVDGAQRFYNIIMKKIMYKNGPAVVIYMFDLTSSKKIQQELQYHDGLLEVLGNVANLLLTADAKELDSTLYQTLKYIGEAADVDRAYVWKNHMGDDGRLLTSQVFEWSPNIEPVQGNDLAENIVYDEVVPSWKETLYKGISVNSLVKDMIPEEQAHLEPQNVVSLLLVPIFLQDKFWGFIGFDDCRKERHYTKMEENFLRICGFMVMVISDTIKGEVTTKLLEAREEALVSARTKSNFLANMSHEIRTPMNAILGMTELILHDSINETVIGHATDIRNACRGLLAIINDILDISKIEAGKLEMSPVRYNISSLLIDIISIIKMRTDKKDLAFVVNIDTNIPSELYGDELRIKQILINLLSNAVKFTKEGQITLSVESKIEDGICQLTFCVVDTGIGIKQEEIENIFVLFQQIDTKKNRNIEGTGLGLSISKQLSEMMDGYIEVESEYGVGSTFTAVIKQKILNEHPVAKLKNPKKNAVLVYENRSVYLSSITHSLNMLGCNYKVCENQSEMFDRLDDFKCDYIFVSSLYENKILEVAKNKHPNAVIIILSGEGDQYLKGGMISISMPIHCLQIANILNDDYSEFEIRNSDAHDSNLVAPDAKVLIVDDNIVNLKVGVGLLSIYQIKADTAQSGMDAIEMVKQNDYDLIFMDHMMPDMDGVDATVAIRQLGEEYSSLPVIALTANAVVGVKEMFQAEGLDDFLAKPIEMVKLEAILKRWLPKEKLSRAKIISNTDNTFTLSIKGVNTQQGIINSGGTIDKYNDILSVYVTDCENRLSEIVKYHKVGKYRSVTIGAHALKSASANIGAEEIADMALELENAGKNDDEQYIDANMKMFVDALSALLIDIREYLRFVQKDTVVQDKDPDEVLLKKSLDEILDGIDNLDFDAVSKIMDDLVTYNWDDDTFVAVSEIKNCIDTFNYSDIEDKINGIKRIHGI